MSIQECVDSCDFEFCALCFIVAKCDGLDDEMPASLLKSDRACEGLSRFEGLWNMGAGTLL